MLNSTNRTSRFLFEDNCNSSKNPSSIIRVPSPKRHLTKYLKKFVLCSLEDRQGLIKRISLNTWIFIVVFNEILIPQDSFSRTTVTRQRIRCRKFMTKFKNHLKFHISFILYIYIFMSLKKWKIIIITPHDTLKWCVKILEKETSK